MSLLCINTENLFSGDNIRNNVYPENATIDQIQQEWILKNCDDQLFYYINNYTARNNDEIYNILLYNYNNALQSQVEMNNFIVNYLRYYSFTDDVTSPLYSPFQNTIINTCRLNSNSGICDTFLSSFCSNYDEDDLLNSPTLSKLCGCYTFQKVQIYGTAACLIQSDDCVLCESGETTNNGNQCFPLLACSPLCRSQNTIKRSNIITGELISCPQNVCVITDSIIRTQGSANFNNICVGCNKTGIYGCNCIIDVSETYASEINVRNFCGDNSQYIVNGNQVTESDFHNKSDYKFKGIKVTWIIIVSCLILLIIILLLLYLRS